MGEHCAVHDILFSQMGKDLQAMAKSMTEALERIANQSSSNGDKLEQVLLSQGERKAVCARQDQRIEGLEKDASEVWDKMTLAEAKTDASFNKLWDALNSLRRIVWVGTGIFIAAQIALKLWLKV